VRRRLAALSSAITAAVALVVAGCGSGGDLAAQQPTNRLEVMSWWTSASEKPALESLLESYKATHSGVTVVDGAVAGGGGSNVSVVLASRLQAGDPPDVWQTFVGSSTQAYARKGRIADVSSVYASANLAGVLPKGVLDAVTVDGKQYSVPTGSHRSNVLFFSKTALAKAGVTPPAGGYTMPAFLADLAKVGQSGGTGLCLGGKDAFAPAELFENILLSTVGADGWSRIGSDRFDWYPGRSRYPGSVRSKRSAGCGWDDGACLLQPEHSRRHHAHSHDEPDLQSEDQRGKHRHCPKWHRDGHVRLRVYQPYELRVHSCGWE